MLLGMLWRGNCLPAQPPTNNFLRFLSAFRFPLIPMHCSELSAQDIRIAFTDEVLLPHLSLADALHEELGLDTPEGAAIVLLGAAPQGSTTEGLRLAAALLYALILRSDHPQPSTLFEWAMRSLACHWDADPEVCGIIAPSLLESVICECLDYPMHRAEMSLQSYLALLDSGYVRHAPDPSLTLRLSQTDCPQAWLDMLCARFISADCRRKVA